MKLFNRDFRLVVIGQIVSMFGASILRFALSLYILEMTESAAVFGTILGLSIIPAIFLSPIGGVIADRFDKKKLMVLFDSLTSVFIGFFAIILFSGNSSVLAIGLLMTILTVISAMYQPAVQSSLPLLVKQDQLLKSNGIVSGVMAVSNFLGPVLGGFLFTLIGINMIVIISLISFILAAVMECFVRVPFEKKEMNKGIHKAVISDMKQGVNYIFLKDSFILKTILIAFLINLGLAPVFLVGLPYIITVLFNLPETYYGFAESGISLSIIFAVIAIGALKDKIDKQNLYIWFLACGVLFSLMALGTTSLITSKLVGYMIVTACSMLVMFSLTIVNIFINTLIQLNTPTGILGKVMSIQAALVMAAIPVGQILFGNLLDQFSEDVNLLLFGTGILSFMVGMTVKKIYNSQNKMDLFDQSKRI